MPVEPLVLRVDWLIGAQGPLIDAPGRVGLSACPGRTDVGGDVTADIAQLHALGISVVGTFVEDREMQYYGVFGLRSALREARIHNIYFPMPDTEPPDDLSATRDVCLEVLSWLGEGESVLLHCIGGWGRSGTIAASLLVHQGYDAKTAIGLVRKARSPRCIESRAQEGFVQEYATAQKSFRRYYYLATKHRLGELLTGERSARRLRGAWVPRVQLIDAVELPHALQRWPERTQPVVLSGEVPVESSSLVRDYPVDRAFCHDGQRWVATPIRQLIP